MDRHVSKYFCVNHAVLLVSFISVFLFACGGGGGGDSTGSGGTADTTPPSVASTTPANGATGVGTNSSITVTFSEPIDSSTINASTFSVNNGLSNISGSVSYSGTTAIFTPTTSLSISTLHTVTITTGVKDAAGNALSANHNWSFTTTAVADTTPPTVTSTNPVNNQTGVAINGSISATFSEAINPSTINATTLTLQAGSTSITGTVALTGNTAIFTPSTALSTNTAYTVTITTGVKDVAGNALSSNYVWNFTSSAGSTSGILDNNWNWAPKSNQTIVYIYTESGIKYQDSVINAGQETLSTTYGSVTTTKLLSNVAYPGSPLITTLWVGVANNKLIQFKETGGSPRSNYFIIVDFPATTGKSWLASSNDPYYGTMTANVISTNETLLLPIGTITNATRIRYTGSTGLWTDQYFHTDYPFLIKSIWSWGDKEELKEILN